MRMYDVYDCRRTVNRLRLKKKLRLRVARKKRGALAGTELPLSVARDVVQSHDHSVRELGIVRAAMF